MAKIGKILLEADVSTKTNIVTTLLDLFAGYRLCHDAVIAAVCAVLSGSDGHMLTPSCSSRGQQQFVCAATQLLFVIANYDVKNFMQLVCEFTDTSTAMQYVDCVLLCLRLPLYHAR